METVRKLQKYKVSLSAFLIFMAIFIITNVSYMTLTKNAIISEANKRLDVQAEYVRHHIVQIKESDAYVQQVVNSNMTRTMKYVEKKLGPHINTISEAQLKAFSDDLELTSLGVYSRVNVLPAKRINVSPAHMVLPLKDGLTVVPIEHDQEYFYYQSDNSDYVIQITDQSNSTPADISTRVSKHIAMLNSNPINLYNGKPLTLEFILTETTNGDYNSIENMVANGSYEIANMKDIEYVKKVTTTGLKRFFIEEVDGKSYEKYFMPLTFGGENFVLFLISDYELLEQVLYDQVIDYVYAIILSSTVFLILCYVLYRWFIYRKQQALKSVESAYKGNLDSLFQSIRAQRHDFNNHMAAVHALITMKAYDDLSKYTANLVEEATTINDILNINCPPIMGLIQAKVAHAANNRIRFKFEVQDFRDINIKHIKASELVSVLGNLIDNAFEAVLSEIGPSQIPEVKLISKTDGNSLIFTVYNNGPKVTEEIKQKIFEPEFTTKKTGTGLGLHIVGQITKKYDGSLTLDFSNEDGTQFTAKLSL